MKNDKELEDPRRKRASKILEKDDLAPDQVKQSSYFLFTEDEEGRISLLPNGLAMHYPLTFEKGSGAVLEGELNFYTKVPYQNLPNGEVIDSGSFTIQGSRGQAKALVANILDNCFGHALLKMLDLKNLYERFGQDHEIVAITPKALEHFIPDDKFRKVVIYKGFQDLKRCYGLDPILDRLRSEYEELDFGMIDLYPAFKGKEEVRNFFSFQENGGLNDDPKKAYVTFFYRTWLSRKWGGSFQHRRIIRLFKELRSYFGKDVQFVVIGEKDNKAFPEWIRDLRSAENSPSNDRKMVDILSNSYMTFGVMGSNMLLPSLFSKMSVHLVPQQKLRNSLDEVINTNKVTAISSLEDLCYYGDPFLLNLKPKKIAERTVVLFHSLLNKRAKFALSEGLGPGVSGRSSQYELVQNDAPHFLTEKADRLKQSFQDRAIKGVVFKFYRLMEKMGY